MNNEKEITPTNEDLNVVKYEPQNIKNLIFNIRGKQVMLDSDVAMLYQYTTKNINKAVKRNIERFPEDFCFQLTEEEMKNLRFQFGTSSLEKDNYGGRRYLPYVFTEQGIAMLAGILKSEIAVKMSISIIKAFIEMRKFIIHNGPIFERLTVLEYKQIENEKNFNKLFTRFEENEKLEIKQKIFFEGQIWDSYSLIIDIIKRAKEKILIIDNYIDDSILKILSKKNEHVKVVILTSNKSNILKLDIEKFNKQYPILQVAKTEKFHDRFIVIDNKELYHIGASLKDLGKKCFGINKIEDMNFIEMIEKTIK